MNVNSINIINKKAKFEYEFLEKYVSGIVLYGSEIKSIRQNKVSMTDCYCLFIHEELWIRNLHISPYQNAPHQNHETKRDRKLLLNKIEITKIKSKVISKGLTIIPNRLFVDKKGRAKIEISIAKGKKQHDKRESIKMRESNREIDRLKKNFQ